jgi:putative hydrolase of the HAD superfamily
LAAAADAGYRRLRLAIHHHGHELPAERCVATVLDQMGIAIDATTIARGVDEMMRATLDEATPMVGAVETINALSAAGVRLGIVSSAVYHPFLEWTLERFGIRDAFAVVTTSASVGYYKSRPEIYWETLRELRVTAGNSVHIGDSIRFDVGGAQRAGMRTVLISANHNGSDPDVPVPDLVVPTLEDSTPGILGVFAAAG